ncbi:MAG: hypothetical protein ACFFKA_18605 [Candidatus Thorarchaeota archaeon]
MRKELAKRYGQRDRFYGTFDHLGKKTNWYTGKLEITVLLLNIRDKTGKVVTDHLWFNYTKEFQKIKELKQGDLIRFEARIDTYRKGYEKDFIDYKLSRPSKMVRIKSLKFAENS